MDQAQFVLKVTIQGVAMADAAILEHVRLALTESLFDCLRVQTANLSLERKIEMSKCDFHWSRVE